ncbi:MAG: tetratricopeptide repeat protein [Verrucomicrobiales bacterium]|nr:tetratricopeptide repeat protein [Verrucomicrobiales bacterium]
MSALKQRNPGLSAVLCFIAGVCSCDVVVGQNVLEDFADVYVDRYFEPPEALKLSLESKNKAEALAQYSVGRMFENEGRIGKAITAYQKVLRVQPGEIMLARKTANLLARTGRTDVAREILEATLKENPDDAFAYIVLSEFLYTYHADSEEDRKRSLDLAKQAVGKFPQSSLAHEHLVKRYLLEGDREKAREVISNASSGGNDDPQYWLRLARTALRVWPRANANQQPSLINEIYKKALDAGRDNLAVRRQVSEYYMATRQFDEAEKLLKEIIEDHPEKLDVRRGLYALYRSQGKEEEAIGALKGIVAINPQDAATHLELGQIHLDRMNKAVREAGARVPKPDNPDLIEAAESFKKALRTGKPDSRQFLLTGELFRLAESYDDAISVLDRGAYLYPEDPSFLKEAAEVYSYADRYDESVKKFAAAEKLATQAAPEMLDEYFYFQFGAATERGGNVEPAADLFRKSIELLTKNDPNQEQNKFTALVYNYLGYMWVENDMNIDEGGELIKTALSLDPESGAITDSLGWYYFKKEKFEDARKELLKAERIMREEAEANGEEYEADSVILDHLGQAHWMTGYEEEAIAYMENAVKHDPEKKEYAERLKKYREGKPPVERPKPAVDTPDPDSPSEVEDGSKSDSPPAVGPPPAGQ